MDNRDPKAYLNMLGYFWHCKGNIERYVDFDREYMIKNFPEILKVWDDYKLAEKTLDELLRY